MEASPHVFAHEGRPQMTNNSTLLNERQTAERLGLTTRTLQRWRVSGAGPRYMRIGPRMIRYAESDVVAWAESRGYASRAAELAG